MLKLSSAFCSCPEATVNWLPERKSGNEKGEKDETKTKVSDQDSKFNFQLLAYIGKTHRPIPLFQLD